VAHGCEEHGIPALFRSDHYLSLESPTNAGSLDAWGTLCGLAAETSTVRLGTMVSPVTFRHPAVLARLAVTADHISGGRIDLGLGAGWNEPEHAAFGFPFPDTRTRMAILAEQFEIVRGLTDPGPFAFSGEHYELAEEDALPKPVQERLPIIAGGSGGPKSAALAARFADEYNTVFATPVQARERRETVLAAWREAGRDPDTLRFSVMTFALIGRDEGELLERAGKIAAHSQSGRSPREELEASPEGGIVGTLDAAAEQLRALADVGVDRVMLQLLVHDDVDQLELIGRELAPALA
jgi:alkanesulfonate monooxygenase SsuD/methylene tetrahydromethanopterin reductase-like flavin-dependent oxidoreductase (luciferase family)